jgi:hypothetical protein
LHGHHRHGRHDSLLVVVEDRYKQLLLWGRTRGRGGKYPPKQKEMCCWYWAWSACWAWAIVGPLLPLLFLWDRRVPDSLPFLPHSRRQAAQLSSDRRRRPSPVIMSSSSSKLHLPADDSVLLLLTHSNLSTFSSDIRVSKQTSVEALKDKLWRKTGTSVAFMRLQLRDDTGAMIADLDHDDATLASYSPYDGYRLHIIDLDPSSITSGGWLEDTSLVEKYTISDEAYNNLDTNFRKFKEKMAFKNPTSDDKQQVSFLRFLAIRSYFSPCLLYFLCSLAI